MLSKKGTYRYIFWFTLFGLIVTILNHNFAYINLGYDYELQSLIAKNFIEGNGFSRPVADPSNLSLITYKRLALWPLGYPILHAPLLLWLNFDAILTYRVFGTASDLFLLITLVLVAKRYLNKWSLPILFVIWMFSTYPFYGLAINDTLSLAFLILSFYLASFITTQNTRKNVLYFIMVGIISFMPALFRYAYYPLIFAVPIYIIWLWWNKSEYKIKKYIPIITSGVLLLCQIILMKVYFSFTSNPIEDVIPEKKSLLYWSNLYSYDSVFINSLIDDDHILRIFKNTLILNHLTSLRLVLSSIIVVLLILSFYFNRLSLKKNDFLKLVIVSAIINTFFLTALSLWFPPFSLQDDNFNRTWIWFTRYHAVSVVGIQIFLIHFLTVPEKLGADLVKKGIATLIIFVTLFNSYYWLIHERKLKIYEPIGVIADAKHIGKLIVQNNSSEKPVVYLSSKIGTKNEFAENDFAGNLLPWVDAYGSYNPDIDSLYSNKSVYCLISLERNSPINISLQNKFRINPDTLLFSENLNKYIIGLEFKP